MSGCLSREQYDLDYQRIADWADKTAKPVTPYGAWLALRRPLLNAVDAAEAAPALDWQPGSTAAYEAARAAVVVAARAALREFDRKHPRPHTAKVWKDVGRFVDAA